MAGHYQGMSTDLTEQLSRGQRLGVYALGGLVGGVVGGLIVIAVISALKALLDLVSVQATWVIIVLPVVGLALTSVLLNGFGRRAVATTAAQRPR